jgi:hypothetical protein
MSEDITKEPIPTSRTESPEELPDYTPLDVLEVSPYPWQMTAAGVLWIVLSVLVALVISHATNSGQWVCWRQPLALAPEMTPCVDADLAP